MWLVFSFSVFFSLLSSRNFGLQIVIETTIDTVTEIVIGVTEIETGTEIEVETWTAARGTEIGIESVTAVTRILTEIATEIATVTGVGVAPEAGVADFLICSAHIVGACICAYGLGVLRLLQLFCPCH